MKYTDGMRKGHRTKFTGAGGTPGFSGGMMEARGLSGAGLSGSNLAGDSGAAGTGLNSVNHDGAAGSNSVYEPVSAAEIRSMTTEQVEARRAELSGLLRSDTTFDESAMTAVEAEISELEARSHALAEDAHRNQAARNAAEQRRQAMLAVLGGAGTVIGRHTEGDRNGPEQRLKAILDSDAYLDAYANGIKASDNDMTECRALLTNLVDGGSVPIPSYVAERVETAWNRMSILPRLRQTFLKGIAKIPFELSADPASIHTEGAAAPSEENVRLGTVSILPAMVKKWITYSDEVAALTGRVFIDYIFNEIEYRILKLAEDTALDRVLNAPSTATLEAPAVSAITIPDIDASTVFRALACLADEATRPVAIMHKQTYFNRFMSLTDTTGRPIYNVVTDNGAPAYFISGLEVLFSDKLTPMTELIVGDLDGLCVNLPEGFGVKFTTDPYTHAEQDLVKVVGKMYAGFGVVRDHFFTKVTVSANSGSGSDSGSGSGSGGGGSDTGGSGNDSSGSGSDAGGSGAGGSDAGGGTG